MVSIQNLCWVCGAIPGGGVPLPAHGKLLSWQSMSAPNCLNQVVKFSPDLHWENANGRERSQEIRLAPKPVCMTVSGH